MALGDIKVLSNGGLDMPSAIPCRVVAGGTTINAGEPCKTSTAFVIPSADAEPVTSAPTFFGVSTTTSDQTASADGDVQVIPITSTMILEVKAKSAAAVDTIAEIRALLNSLVLFDLTSGSYTVDTASTGATFGLIIVGGDVNKATVWVRVRTGATTIA